MDVCGLAKARPILCNDSPAFQRRHTSVRCAAESSTYFPCVIHTTFEQRFHIRWCCIDPLRSPALPDISNNAGSVKLFMGALLRSFLLVSSFVVFFGPMSTTTARS